MDADLAEQVIEVPREFESGPKSTACLLKDAGFPEARDELSVRDVEKTLTAHPELADLWFERASDQRLAGGWGIECEDNKYRIQSFKDGKTFIVRNRLRACAEFIVRYVKFIGDVLARTRTA